MNKKVILLVGLLLIVASCTRTIVEKAVQYSFVDSGDNVENYKECNRLMKEGCDNKYRCVGYRIVYLECNGQECVCG